MRQLQHAELDDLYAPVRHGSLIVLRAESAISAAERMKIGHGPDKFVPVDWLVLMIS